MPHYLTGVYSQSDAYIRGVRANPSDTSAIVDALGVLCAGLTELADDGQFWDALVEHLEANPEDVAAQLDEVAGNLDEFLKKELDAVTEDMGDDEAARRLLDDLGVTVAGAGFDPNAIRDVRDATEWFRDQVCTERDTLQEAIARNDAGWRGRFRALRVAISGTFFVGGAAVVGVNIGVVTVEPVTGVGSMKVGISAMMAAFKALRADLELRNAGG